MSMRPDLVSKSEKQQLKKKKILTLLHENCLTLGGKIMFLFLILTGRDRGPLCEAAHRNE